MTQDHCCPLGRAEARQQAHPRLALVPTTDRIGGRLSAGIEDQLGRRNPPHTGSVAAGIEQDRRQPAAQSKLADPGVGPSAEGAVRPHERVLDQLLRIVAIAARPERNREQAVLMGQHQGLERSI